MDKLQQLEQRCRIIDEKLAVTLEMLAALTRRREERPPIDTDADAIGGDEVNQLLAPLVIGQQQQQHQQQQPPGTQIELIKQLGQPAPITRLNILVVEDDPACGIIISRILRHLGHQCTVVDDGWAAIHAILSPPPPPPASTTPTTTTTTTTAGGVLCKGRGQGPTPWEGFVYNDRGELAYDLVLMDICLPHLDGLSATSYLRAAGLTLPIIAMTALKGQLSGNASPFAIEPGSAGQGNQEHQQQQHQQQEEDDQSLDKEEQMVWAQMGLTGGLVLGKPFGVDSVKRILEALRLQRGEHVRLGAMTIGEFGIKRHHQQHQQQQQQQHHSR